MKRFVILAGILIVFLIGIVSAEDFQIRQFACSEPQTIFQISGVNNAHGAKFDFVNSPYKPICFSELFTGTYPVPAGIWADHQTSNGGANTVLRLSAHDNAHGAQKDFISYTETVSFGDLSCRHVLGNANCAANEAPVIFMSALNNAHFSTRKDATYPITICCSTQQNFNVRGWCGNGHTEIGAVPPEQCDDGNTANGDGCSATCQTEGTGTCTPGTIQTGTQCLICNAQGTGYGADNSKCTSGKVCTTQGQCVECTTDAQCSARTDGKTKCDLTTNVCVTPTQTQCSLTKAYWSINGDASANPVDLTVNENAQVYLVVEGTNCNTQSPLLKVTEGGLVSQGLANTQPSGVAFANGVSKSTWNAQWVNDVGTDPEWLIEASIGVQKIDGLNKLNVLKASAPPEPQITAYWADSNEAQLSPTATKQVGDSVKLVAQTTNFPAGTKVAFNIKEKDASNDDNINTFDPAPADIDANGKARVVWLISEADLAAANPSSEDEFSDNKAEFYFVASGAGKTASTATLDVIKDHGCAAFKTESSCNNAGDFQTIDSGLYDYYNCGDNVTVSGKQCTISCSCSWSGSTSSSGTCGVSTGNSCPADNSGGSGGGGGGTVIVGGTCTRLSAEEQCDESGFKVVHISATPSIGYTDSSCVNEDIQVPCGRATTQLPFFGAGELIISVLTISLIYLIVIRKKLIR